MTITVKNKNFYLASLFCLTLAAAIEGEAVTNAGAWKTAGANSWDSAISNWQMNTAATFPNGATDIASFTAFPSNGVTIDSKSNITIGQLFITMDSVLPLLIDFTSGGPHTLTFDNGGDVGCIYASGNASITTPIVLNSNLEIHASPFNGAGGVLQLQNISGGNNVVILGDPEGKQTIELTGASTFGSIILQKGFLTIAAGNGVHAIPSGLAVGQKSQVTFTQGQNNNFNVGNLNVVGGVCDLNGSTQTVLGASFFGPALGTNKSSPQPNLTSSSSGELLILAPVSAVNPPPAFFIGEDAQVLANLSFQSPNAQANTLAYVTSAFFDGSRNKPPTSGHAIIGDPTGTQPKTITALFPLTIDVALGGQSDYDLGIFATTFLAAPVTKTDSGNLLLGNLTTVPFFEAAAGVVTIGLNAGDTVTSSSPFFNVDAGATLQGVGILNGGTTVTNNGLVAPGTKTEIGKLTIAGNYTQTGTGELLFKVQDKTTSDQLIVQNGPVVLAGALVIEAVPGATINPGDEILLIDNTTGTGITGAFTSVTGNLPNGLLFTLIEDPNNKLFALFDLRSCNICPPCPPPPVPPAPSLTSYFDPGAMLFAVRSEHNLQLTRRMQAARERFCSCDPASLYAAVFGSVAGEVEGFNGYDFNTVGGLIGFDYALSWGAFGVRLSYEHYDADVDHHWGNFEIDEVFGEFYGTLAPFCNQNFFIDMAAGGGSDWYEINRHTDEGTAKAKPHGWEWDAYLGLGYDWHWCDWRFTPLAAVKYINLEIDDYREHGAGDLDVKVRHQRRHSLRSWLGLSIGDTFEGCWATWMPEVHGYWQHEFAEEHHTISVTSSNFNSRSVVDVFTEGRNFGVIGAELKSVFCEDITAAVSYDFYWSEKVQTNFLYGELGVNF